VEGEGFSKCDSDSLEGVDGKTSYKSEFEPEGMVSMLSVGRYFLRTTT